VNGSTVWVFEPAVSFTSPTPPPGGIDGVSGIHRHGVKVVGETAALSGWGRRLSKLIRRYRPNGVPSTGAPYVAIASADRKIGYWRRGR
jgi:hypothetical protein